MGSSPCGGELSASGCSTEMINNGRSDSDRQVLVKRVGEHLLPTAQTWRLRWLSSPIAAPDTGTGHIDLFCYLTPTQALVTQLRYLISRSGMSGSTDAAHGDAGALELFAHSAPVNAKLGTDLAQGPALLNIYTSQPKVFDDSDIELTQEVATWIAIAVGNAEAAARRSDYLLQLRTVMLSRDLIEQAKGILMERHKITEDEAFTILTHTS